MPVSSEKKDIEEIVKLNIHDRIFCLAYADELDEPVAEILRWVATNEEMAIFYDFAYPSFAWDLFVWGSLYDYTTQVLWNCFRNFDNEQHMKSLLEEVTVNDKRIRGRIHYVKNCVKVVKFPCRQKSFYSLEHLLKFINENYRLLRR